MKRFDFDSVKWDEGVEAREGLYKGLRIYPELKRQFTNALNLLLEAIEQDKKILIFGNGGSAADASHFAAELVCQFQSNGRRALAAMSLTADPAILTAQSNDYEFETVFSRQIEAFCQPGDVVVGLTTSDAQVSDTWHGHSCNILRTLVTANEIGAHTVGLFSLKTDFLLAHVEVAVVVPHRDTAIIQEAHQMIFHEFCRHIDQAF